MENEENLVKSISYKLKISSQDLLFPIFDTTELNIPPLSKSIEKNNCLHSANTSYVAKLKLEIFFEFFLHFKHNIHYPLKIRRPIILIRKVCISFN